MQLKSVKLAISLCALLTASCDSPIDPVPCIDACEGLELTLDSITVAFPQPNVAYSGDVIRVIVRISNRGTVANDANTFVFAKLDHNDKYDAVPDIFASTKVNPLRPGDDVRLEVRLKYPLTSATSQLRDSVFVKLYRMKDPGRQDGQGFYFKEFAARYSRPFNVTSATFELRVPETVQFPSMFDQALDIIVTNPTPRVLTSAIVDFCAPPRDYCLPYGIVDGFVPANIASIPAGQTAMFRVGLGVTRTAWNDQLWQQPQGVNLMACVSGSCRSAMTRFQPVFEKFCTVLPVQLGETLSGNTQGRCGVGSMTNRLDIRSFEAVAGNTVTLTATSVRLTVYTAAGAIIARTSSNAGGQLSFNAPYTGLFYAFMVSRDVAAAYTLRLEPNP